MARRRGPGEGNRTIIGGRGALVLLVGILLLAPGAAVAQEESLRIGFVDMQAVQNQYLVPNLQGPRAELEQRVIDLQAEFDQRSVALDDEEKQVLFDHYQNQLDAEAAQLYQIQAGLEARIQQAIASVASDQGFEIVLVKEAVLSGGADLTGAVLRRLGVQTLPAGGG